MWLSVLAPVAAVKASRTDGGSVTALDRYALPSTVTVILPPETLTPTSCVPVRRAGHVVAVAAKVSSPF